MAPVRYRHIFLSSEYARTQGFTSPRQGGESPRIPGDRDRAGHSGHLEQRIGEAWNAAEQHKAGAAVHMERHGAYIEFEGAEGFDLAIQSLENLRSGIRLLNVRKEGEGEKERVLATLYIPYHKRGYFLRKIRAYATEEDRRSKKPKNAKLVNSISDIRHATLKSFWRPDEWHHIPTGTAAWVEVWLGTDSDEAITRFETLLETLGITSAEGVLIFPERAVKLLQATRQNLERLIETTDDIAECRAAKELATFYLQMQNKDQVRQVQDLLRRTKFNGDGEVVVCVLDTGINNGHQLIQPVLNTNDIHVANPAWNGNDHNGHGTLMAGTIIYGDLHALLNSTDPVKINHRLESAKILPPPPATNPRELWGYMMTQGISRAEIQAPERKRIICMAVTSRDSRERGRPSSWSATVDEITAGYMDDKRRLVIICGGNVNDPAHWRNYPADNLTNEVHDPGQAWNALTVGAFTEKTRITDPTMTNYASLAPAGGLSPFSTTSTTWLARKWPIKPEVVLEGGNVASGPNESLFDHDDLQLLSTYHDPQVAQFAQFNMTSASSALAAWMAAQIQAQYPTAWPETVRALIVHTAEWTNAMKTQFLLSPTPSKQDYAKLLRICGYGVPNLERALYCASNSLTLISEAELQPFDLRVQRKRNAQRKERTEKRYVTRDMHLYDLPWPTAVLSQLGETIVRMRITLSYFIEPGPGEVGWDNRYRYASHALRFAVNGPGESESEFVCRVNNQARDDGEHPGTAGPGDRWVIGDARNVGSIHSDIWQGQAAELAGSNKIAVYPAVGWWRERHHLNRWNKRTRYSLVVSIHTPEQSADIYVLVSQQIRVPVSVEVPVRQTRNPRGRG